MKYSRIGSSGLSMSRIAYGNAITHGEQVDEDSAQACVRAALDAGITTFDTADLYAQGQAERILGRALAGQRREELVICTKVGRWVGATTNSARLSRKHILESIDGSLQRLGLDYVDLYQAHRYDPETPLDETMTAFADVVRAGKALYIGVSEWPAEQIRAAVELAREFGVSLISNQAQYSVLWRVIEAEVIPASDRLGVGQITWAPLAGGVLTGKYRIGQQPPVGSRAAATPAGAKSIGRWNYLHDKVLDAVGRLEAVAAEAGLSLPELALAWVLRNPSVSGLIVGASSPGQLSRNAKAVAIELDDDLVKRVEEAAADAVRSDPALTLDPLGPAARLD